MNIKTSFESSILFAHNPNFLGLENIDTHFDVTYTLRTATNEVVNTFVQVFGTEHDLDISSVTELIYENVENYIDPFDYTATKLYTEVDGYHYMMLDISLVDFSGSEVVMTDLVIINGALQLNECVLGTDFIDQRLGFPYFETGVVPTSGYLNYDLNFDLH